jgi:N-acylglucosamine-6-phosphate 2-epimerase
VLDRLRGGLVVSIQPEADSMFNTPELVALFARCAQANGAVALRIEGTERIAAVRAAVPLPIVGIIKRKEAGFEPYITPALADVDAIADAGADIVAFDATGRIRPGGASLDAMIERIHERGALAMADCATREDGAAAAEAGADAIATTLFGYTPQTRTQRPPGLALLSEFAALHPFAICEGGIADPDQLQIAFAAGASAVVIGTAITNVDALVRRFASATPRAQRERRS